MARRARIHYPGARYHVMLRGNAGALIFFTDADRRHFLGLIEQGVARFGHRIHAFCLMGNHVHLALQVGEVALSKVAQNLAFRHTRWVNKRKRRTGHLFQGRYQAILVDQDAYLLALTRYIHLNPLRARLVKDPGAYRWSGHRAYLGKETLAWLTTQWVLSQFGERLATARARYARYVAAGHNEGRREEFHRGTEEGGILGDDTFIERVQRQTGLIAARPPALPTITAAVCRALKLVPSRLQTPGRQPEPARARWLIALLATELNSASLTAVARGFGRDVATLSNGVRALRARAQEDQHLRRRIAGLSRQLRANKTSKA